MPMPSADTAVVALDLGPSTPRLLDRATALAERLRLARLHLVHVLDARVLDALAGLGWETRQRLEAQARAAALATLEAHATRLRDTTRCEIHVDLRLGAPATQLLQAARDTDATLIVAGRGGSEWRRWTLGSAARRLLHGAPVALWLVGSDTTRPGAPWLLACDFGPAAAEAAAFARRGHAGNELHLVHVADDVSLLALSLPGLPGPPVAVAPADDPRTAVRVAEFIREHLPDTPVVTHLCAGHPVGTLLRQVAELESEVLVLGRNQRPPWERAVLGSVAEAMCDLATCDLAVVPTAAGSDAAPST